MFSKNELPFLAILRGIEEDDLKPLVDVLVAADIRFLEITMNTPDATNLIRQINQLVENKLVVGAGTVLSLHDLENALSAGAGFIVTPSVIDDVINACVSENIPVIPGALTPTEIHKAWSMGATMIKVFPASVCGPGYIKAIKGPFDKIKVMAVGGVNENNAADFFRNGADAIGFGAGIIRPEWLSDHRYDLIEKSLQELVKKIPMK